MRVGKLFHLFSSFKWRTNNCNKESEKMLKCLTKLYMSVQNLCFVIWCYKGCPHR